MLSLRNNDNKLNKGMQSRKGHGECLTGIGKVHAETWTDENTGNNDSQKEREIKKRNRT